MDVHPDGALTVHDTAAQQNRGKRGHVFLTRTTSPNTSTRLRRHRAHRAQGATVDTSHIIAAPGMTREAFYVAMTRGRHANTTYVITERTDLEQEEHSQPSTEPSSNSKSCGPYSSLKGPNAPPANRFAD